MISGLVDHVINCEHSLNSALLIDELSQCHLREEQVLLPNVVNIKVG